MLKLSKKRLDTTEYRFIVMSRRQLDKFLPIRYCYGKAEYKGHIYRMWWHNDTIYYCGVTPPADRDYTIIYDSEANRCDSIIDLIGSAPIAPGNYAPECLIDYIKGAGK